MSAKAGLISIEELQRQAAATGAELIVDGRAFNAGRAKAPLAKAKLPAPPAPPEPVKVEAPSLTREEVEAMLAERDKTWQASIDKVYEQVLSLTATLAAPKARPTYSFVPEYDEDGRLLVLTATPSSVALQ